MQNKGNSFPVFLNIILSLLLIGSMVFGYFFGNFGGISLKELRENYLLKEEVKFADLPKVIQESYIKKDAISIKPKSLEGLEKVFDEYGNPLEIVDGDINDLKSMIKSLQDRVLFLEQENMLLSNDKNELLKIVQNEKSTHKMEESSLLSKNLEKINEAEKQHYKNISELTLKINDLQRENIALADKLNRQKQQFDEQVGVYEQKLQEQANLAKASQSEALKEQMAKYELLDRENSANAKKIDELNKLLQAQREDEIIASAKKDKQIVGLQNKINELIIEKNTLLTQNSKSVLELEKKSSEKLQQIELSIKKYQEEKEQLKAEYDTLLKESREDFNKLISSLKVENKNLKDEISKLTQNSVMILENSEKSLQTKEEEYKKLLQSAQKKLQEEKNLLLAENQKTKENLKVLMVQYEQVKKDLETQKAQNQADSDRILQLSDKLASLNTQNRKLDEEVEVIVSQNEKKHNENYKFLNDKIALLQMNLQKLSSSKEIEKKKLQEEFQVQSKSLESKYASLNTQLLKAQSDLKQKSLELSNVKDQMEKLSKEKKSLELSEHEKLIAIRDSFKELQEQVKVKENEYQAKIKDLESKLSNEKELLAQKKKDEAKLAEYLTEIEGLKKMLKTLDAQVVNASNTVPISDKKRKLALLGTVECDDMNSGNFQVSSTCKEKVSKFLDNYDTNHYFEVIPIVGKGGFGSLNKIKRDKTAGIPESEIDRLTQLANLGLGKHRAKEGGWLIREKFGDFAKISYTVYNIEADNKRGFVIRAYR
ncbi:MAG TPA: hypothetical protein CFH82_02730 [Sulfurospirillum sp. UBA12182]|nr:MAG TPA: hypothetical protein CFH82_02730 [Sulfurospirillum sp. UBA12182]